MVTVIWRTRGWIVREKSNICTCWVPLIGILGTLARIKMCWLFGTSVLFTSGHNECPQYSVSRVQSPPTLDPVGRHATHCPSVKGFLRRHNHLRDKLYSFLRHLTVLDTKLEYTLLCKTHAPPQDRRRIDILMDNLEFPPPATTRNRRACRKPLHRAGSPKSTQHRSGCQPAHRGAREGTLCRPLCDNTRSVLPCWVVVWPCGFRGIHRHHCLCNAVAYHVMCAAGLDWTGSWRSDSSWWVRNSGPRT